MRYAYALLVYTPSDSRGCTSSRFCSHLPHQQHKELLQRIDENTVEVEIKNNNRLIIIVCILSKTTYFFPLAFLAQQSDYVCMHMWSS